MIFMYFEERGCSREEALHTEITFIEAYFRKRMELSGANKDPRYRDSFKREVVERDPYGDPSRVVDSGVISSDTLMDNKDMRGGLQGLIDKFSKNMKG